MNINNKNIVLISGSLRKDSYNTKVLKSIEKVQGRGSNRQKSQKVKKSL